MGKSGSDLVQSSTRSCCYIKDAYRTENQFEFFPSPDGSYGVELLYYQRVPALSDSNTTNWLLTEAPDVYLYGSLVHSAPYLADDARTAVWAQIFGAAMQRLNQSSDEAVHSGVGLVMKNRGLG